MAVDSFDTTQPVKVALLPLAAARQAVRLASEQNEQLRQVRLTADAKAQESRDAAATQQARDVSAPAPAANNGQLDISV